MSGLNEEGILRILHVEDNEAHFLFQYHDGHSRQDLCDGNFALTLDLVCSDDDNEHR